jgi:hypothetical protein
MTDTRTYFNSWFRDMLSELNKIPNAGFIVLITTLTLLERYLREKSNNHERPNLDDQFFTEFVKLFPQVPDIEAAKKFWKACRHGLMHQATFKTRLDNTNTISEIGIDDTVDVIRYENRGTEHSFFVSPTKLSKHTVKIIENDFATFEGHGSPEHPLPQVVDRKSTGESGYSGYKR